MATVGTAIATGTITTTIAIATKLNPQNRAVSRAQQITAALFLFILIPAFSSRRISFFQGRNIPRPQVFYEYRAQPITSPRDAREDTMFTNVLKSMLGKAVLAAAVIGGALCFAGAPNAQAGERDRDRDRDRIVRHDDYRVREDYRRGFYSPRADYVRQERREAFARGYYDRFGCWHRY
jgi:hypothetical protein